jgi:hypothetical protein
LKTIFSPYNSYQVLHPIEEEVEITIVQTIVEETNGSPGEDTHQFTTNGTPNNTQELDEGNVDTLLRTLEVIVNVFETLDWVIEEGWPQIPKKWLEEEVTKEVNSNNTANEAFGRKLFKLFFQSLERINTRIPLNPPPTIFAPVMNFPPIMAYLLAMPCAYNYLNIMTMKI